MAAPDDHDRATEDPAVEPMRAMAENLRQLVREELATAKDELAASGRRSARAGVLLGAATACGVLAGAGSAVVLLRALDRFLPPVAASAVATALWGAGAAALARAGLVELRRAGPLARHAVQDLRAGAETLRAAPAER